MTVVEFERWVLWYQDKSDTYKSIEAFWNLPLEISNSIREISGVPLHQIEELRQAHRKKDRNV